MSVPLTELSPIKLTLVQYTTGDKLGHLLAYASLLPVAAVVVAISAVAFRRDIHSAFVFLGICASEALNIMLKNYIKEPRPPSGKYLIRFWRSEE
eukprot:Clim_evm88s153 gene=Clim_evmTU88s153